LISSRTLDECWKWGGEQRLGLRLSKMTPCLRSTVWG